jgi:hypothetical protein
MVYNNAVFNICDNGDNGVRIRDRIFLISTIYIKAYSISVRLSGITIIRHRGPLIDSPLVQSDFFFCEKVK